MGKWPNYAEVRHEPVRTIQIDYGLHEGQLHINHCTSVVGVLADTHMDLSTSLTTELIPHLRHWRKESYQKKGFLNYEVLHDAEKRFAKVEQDRVNLLEKMERSRSEYDAAVKAVHEAEIAEEKSSTEEQRLKRRVKLHAAKVQMEVAAHHHHQVLEAVRKIRPHHEERMQEVFYEIDRLEKQRLEFFARNFEELRSLIQEATTKK